MDFAGKITCSGGARGRRVGRVHEQPRRPEGFTLIELMVVLALIVLISAIALPSVARMFSSSADAMAYTQAYAQLEAARACALESGMPAGIHAQLADPVANPSLAGVQYVTVIVRNNVPGTVDGGTAEGGDVDTLTDAQKTWDVDFLVGYQIEITAGSGLGEKRTIQSNTADTLIVSPAWAFMPAPDWEYTITDQESSFIQAPGYEPLAMPGSMVLGDAENFSTGSGWLAITDQELSGDGLPPGDRCFTRFSMIFTTTGVLVRTIDGENISFRKFGDGLFSGATKLWQAVPTGLEEAGVTALTIFDYAEVRALNPTQRQTYLNQSAQYLPVNFYTGVLYPRKGQ